MKTYFPTKRRKYFYFSYIKKYHCEFSGPRDLILLIQCSVRSEKLVNGDVALGNINNGVCLLVINSGVMVLYNHLPFLSKQRPIQKYPHGVPIAEYHRSIWYFININMLKVQFNPVAAFFLARSIQIYLTVKRLKSLIRVRVKMGRNIVQK